MSPELLSRHEPSGPTKRPSSTRPALIVAGVAVAAVLGGTGAASASAASVAPGNAGTGPGSVVQGSAPVGGVQSPGPGMGAPGHGWAMPVHGQIVLAKPGGGYQTVDFQNGSVTKVDSTSITLKSADGFTQSYPINGSTIVSAGRTGIGSVTSGNSAVVIASVSGHTATAVRIIDLSMLKASHQMFGFGMGAHP
jgi:hypothetical protein